jgi:membrane-bound lytic murein transglycosylase C
MPLAVAALLVLAGPEAFAQAKPDALDKAFDDMEKQLEKSMGKLERDLDAYFKKIEADLEKTFAEFESELDRTWGQGKRISTPKVWVGYSDRLDTRFTVDYDTGEVSIETTRTDMTAAQLRSELDRLINSNSDELDEHDQIAKRMKRKTKAAGLDEPPVRPQDRRRNEIGQIVDPNVQPRVDTVPVVGPQGQRIEVKRITVPFNADAAKLNAERLRQPVEAYADNYKLPRALVLSIIKNESSFNPRAQSAVPAFGLMQLVPSSGGADAYTFVLGGKKSMPTPDYLFRPVENVELGAAYLHLLHYRYLDGIRDPASRIYCVIAAYNTGPGNVARAFTGRNNVDAAEAAINRMTSDQVYQTLVAKLPYDETRVYLAKVRRDMELFREWDARRG